MKTKSFSLIRVFVGVIVGITFCIFLLWVYGTIKNINYPFKWSEKKKILKICQNDELTHIDFNEITDKGCKTKYEFKFYFTGYMLNESTLADTVTMFLDIVYYANENAASPLHDESITLSAKSQDDIDNDSIFLYYENGVISVEIYSCNISSFDTLTDLSPDLENLKIANCRDFNINSFFKLRNLKELNLIDCYYAEGGKALNTDDEKALKEALPHIIITD